MATGTAASRERGPKWPYDLPIWRRSHRAVSPDGRTVAEIERAVEVSMGNPTRGTLVLSAGLELAGCSPSFLWSDDSRYLAVPRFFYRLGLFRRQRLVLVDVVERRLLASRSTAVYFQPESFAAGLLEVTREPFAGARRLRWRLPDDLRRFRPMDGAWDTPAS